MSSFGLDILHLVTISSWLNFDVSQCRTSKMTMDALKHAVFIIVSFCCCMHCVADCCCSTLTLRRYWSSLTLASMLLTNGASHRCTRHHRKDAHSSVHCLWASLSIGWFHCVI